MNTVVVVQPSYLPWRGYFDLIRRANTFVFYDDVQYDKHGWRNRNKIKTKAGLQWITIPVHARGNIAENTTIENVEIDGRTDWRRKHAESIRHAYRMAPYFEDTYPFVVDLLSERTAFLADFTIKTTIAIADRLGFKPTFLRSSAFKCSGTKTSRLISLLQRVEATHYISGPSARAYIDEHLFSEAGITLEYIDYRYDAYPQLHGDFEPAVSIVDLLMMTGGRAASLVAANGAS